MVSRCLSATGIRFSAILFPPGSWALLTVGLPNPRSGPRRGYHVPHARAATGEGALWTPGTTVLTPTEATSGRAPAASQRPVPAPRRTSHRQGSRLTRHQRGFKQFARPVFPSPVAARMERAALGLEPRASHPADHLQSGSSLNALSRRRTPGWGQAIEHGPGTTRSTHISRFSNPVVHSMRATSCRTSPKRLSAWATPRCRKRS
jgi:hypothetical protein